MKANRICDLLDRYRDRELSAPERSRFESHLASCQECRTTMSLLNNVVHLIKAEEVHSRDIADRVARQAFQKVHSWDYEVISWIRPVPALAVLTLMLALFSSVLIVSNKRQGSTYSEYETLMEESDASNLEAKASQVGNNNDFVFWLEQEGNSQ